MEKRSAEIRKNKNGKDYINVVLPDSDKVVQELQILLETIVKLKHFAQCKERKPGKKVLRIEIPGIELSEWRTGVGGLTLTIFASMKNSGEEQTDIERF